MEENGVRNYLEFGEHPQTRKYVQKTITEHKNDAQNIWHVFPWISVMAEGKHFFV